MIRSTLICIAAALSSAMATAHAAGVSMASGGWIATLGGFALGGMLGALFGGVVSFVLIAVLLAYAGFTLYRLSRQEQPPASASPAALGALAGLRPVPAAPRPGADAAGDPARAAALAAAKRAFVTLALSDELGALEASRNLVTPEMFAELRQRRLALPQEVVALRAELLELAPVDDLREARVRLSGRRRDAANGEEFRQTWRLAQSRDGTQRWLLARVESAS